MSRAWRFLPPVAIATAILVIGAIVAFSGETFGYDFAAYWLAARHLLDGEPLYDLTVTPAGGYGLWLYPPPAVVFFIPFALFAQDAAAVAWVALSAAASALGIALLPVVTRVRWLVLLLAGLMWPVAYAIKLGQVTPILFLAFVAAWRWMDRPASALGIAGGLGMILKLQPGLLLLWGMLKPRWSGALLGMAFAFAAVLFTLPIVKFGAYLDYGALLARVGSPFDTPNNMAPGAVAAAAGLERGAASLLQAGSTILAMGIFVVTALRSSPAPSLLAAMVVSQLASPVLWEHYAMLLLLPIAWLLERRQWWVLATPALMSVPAVGLTPAWVYPAAFWVLLLAITRLGLREGRMRL